jgi:hypothetical protein
MPPLRGAQLKHRDNLAKFTFFFLYGFEPRIIILREEHRLRLFQNRVLRITFGPKKKQGTGSYRKLHNKNFRTRTLHQLRRVGRAARWERHTKFCSENLKGRGHLEDLGVDGRIRLEWTVLNQEINVSSWRGTQLNTGTTLLTKIDWEYVDWIHLAQDKDHWLALVKMVMKGSWFLDQLRDY